LFRDDSRKVESVMADCCLKAKFVAAKIVVNLVCTQFDTAFWGQLERAKTQIECTHFVCTQFAICGFGSAPIIRKFHYIALIFQ
jgi:hypothetical protein